MNKEHRPTEQKGAALLIGLLLLLVATLVAVAAMQGSQFQERMASNHYNKAISFHAAEVGATRFIEAINQNGFDVETWESALAFSSDPLSPDPVSPDPVSNENDGFGWYYAIVDPDADPTEGEFRLSVFGVSRVSNEAPNLALSELDVMVGVVVIPPGGGGPNDAAINLVGKLNSFEVPNSGALEVCNLENPTNCTNQVADEEKIAVGPAIGISSTEDAGLISSGLEANGVIENYHGAPAVATVEYPDLWTNPEAMRAFVNRACTYAEDDPDGTRCATNGEVPANTVVEKNAVHEPNLTVIRGSGTTELDFRGGKRGEGILIVEGTLRTRGTPNWDGIIIVLGGEFHITGGGSGGVNGTMYLLNLDMSAGADGKWTVALDDSGNEAGVTFKSDGGGNAKFNHNCDKVLESLTLLDYQESPAAFEEGMTPEKWFAERAGVDEADLFTPVDEKETSRFLAGDWLSNAHGCDPAGGIGPTTTGRTEYSIVRWHEVLR